MSELTAGEITRKLEELERRVTSKVSRELYDRDLLEIKGDLREIKDGQAAYQKEEREGRRTLQSMIIAQFIALIVGLVLFLVGRI
jgi:hypothetical protein